MKKLYGANVVSDMVDYFEEQVYNHMHGDIEIVERDLRFDSNWNPVYHYTLRAEEGIIDPRWEVILPKVEV